MKLQISSKINSKKTLLLSRLTKTIWQNIELTKQKISKRVRLRYTVMPYKTNQNHLINHFILLNLLIRAIQKIIKLINNKVIVINLISIIKYNKNFKKKLKNIDLINSHKNCFNLNQIYKELKILKTIRIINKTY